MEHNVAVAVNADDEQLWIAPTGEEVIKYIVKAGFKKVFIGLQASGWGEKQSRVYEQCVKNNLEIEFVHMPYYDKHYIAKIWEEGKDGDDVINEFIKDVTELSLRNIKIAVMHPCSQGYQTWNEIGLNRWKKLINHAEKVGVIIAFENLRYKDVLDYLFDNIKSLNMKICYDIGHDHCHFKDSFDFEKYKDKVVATHIHDNDGNKDQHYLPFDGNVDWVKQFKKLKENNSEILNVALGGELYYREIYLDLKPQKFFNMAYKRLCKLEKIMKQV